jgi:hypothetical protein
MLKLMADAGETVKALEARPILQLGLDVYFQAYNDLSFDRPTGFSVGYIPWSSITKWCELHGIYDIDDIATCIRYIRALEKFDNDLAEKKAPKA